MKLLMGGVVLAVLALPVRAEVEHYAIDPEHTYVSFEAPHIQGISIWRGKFDTTKSGAVTLDRTAKTGSLEVVIDTSSVDSGHAKLNDQLRKPEFFDVAKFPTAVYKADTVKFEGDTPSEVDGQLTLHGVTRPVVLKINSFKCIMHPMLHKQVCGADAAGEINRSEFGMGYGVQFTGSPQVKLAIQVEALKQ
jgi:polyisoprenoid-binding protein YceI